ncbi:MAG: phosphodiester glycosidase family protein [Thermotogota bacterium]
MKKFIIIVFMLSSFLMIYSNAHIITKTSTPSEYKTIKKSGEFFINSDILERSNIIKNESNNVSFYVFNQKVLELNHINQYSKINFINRYDNSLLESDNNLYIREDIISSFLSLDIYKNTQNIYFYDEMPVIKNIDYTNNMFSLEFDRNVSNSMFKINKVNGGIILAIKPVLDIKYIPSDLNYTYDRGQIFLKFDDVPRYEQNLDSQIYTINFNYSEEKVDHKEGDLENNGLDYKEEKYTIAENDLRVYSLTFDPKNYDLNIGLNQIGKANTSKTYFEENEKILAAINASYFDVNTLEPLGNIIVDGQLEHLSAYSRPAFYINENGEMNIDYVKLEYKVDINGLLFWVKAINSEWKAEVKLYTDKYKGDIEENTDSYTFLVIENNEIKKINSKQFTDNQKLLLIDKKYDKYLENIEMGTPIDFSITYSENIKTNIHTLIEGGPILLNDKYSEELLLEEKRAYSNGIIYGKSPRTAFAIDEKNMVTFIVAQGYNDENLGLNYDGMKELINKMGNYRKAIMFDGGGSSLFYFKDTIINNGSERLRDYIPVFINIYPKK